MITVPTPLRDGLPDLAYVEAASRMLARYLRPGATVIVESTSYPGTTQEQVLARLEDGSGLAAGTDFHLGYSPERIDPGNRTWTQATTPPTDYPDFIALEASARLVLTHSCGVQEKSTVVGAPCLTLRDSTERPITVTEGTNQLVGRDPGRIVRAALEVMAARPPMPGKPARWDGQPADGSRPRYSKGKPGDR